METADNNAARPIAPHPVLEEYYRREEDRAGRLSESFDATAQHYDGINRLMSFGSDRWYRRQALLRAGLTTGMKVLDVGCGTGLTAGLAAEITGNSGLVVGVDPSAGMLDVARQEGRVRHGVRGEGQALPVADNRFDLVTMTFALRHVPDLVQAFAEYRRVLKPGGKVLILEITVPDGGLRRRLLKFHMKRIVPMLASLRFRNAEANWCYRYCWESHARFAGPGAVRDAFLAAGLREPAHNKVLGLFSEFSAVR